MTTNVKLSTQQIQAVTKCIEAIRKSKIAVLAGAAGTGKTTTANEVINQWGGTILFLAPTGKAASRCAEVTGYSANTIHSAVYGSAKTETAEETDEKGNTVQIVRLIEDTEAELKFGKPTPIEGVDGRTLVVVDESSMVDKTLADDLITQVFATGGNLLFMGDHEQLPPVGGDWGVDLQNPTAKLTQVYRQASDAPVLGYATAIRENKGHEFEHWNEDDCRRMAGELKSAVQLAIRDNYQLITFTNKTREAINSLYRFEMGYGFEPQQDETLVCLLNNRNVGYMNGEQIKIETIEVHTEATAIWGRPIYHVNKVNEDDGSGFFIDPKSFTTTWSSQKSWFDRCFWEAWTIQDRTFVSRKQQNYHNWQFTRAIALRVWGLTDKAADDKVRARRTFYRNRMLMCTWGYGMTVHKSQGSQWENVMYVECNGFRGMSQSSPDFGKRLLYTAVTRTEKKYIQFRI